MRLLAYMVQRGDMVTVGDEQRQVKEARLLHLSHGRSEVVMVFKSGPSIRVNANAVTRVQRTWRRSRRDAR
ncbi:hypothetical protein ACPCTO_11720 [Streptomyces olivoreticuli]